MKLSWIILSLMTISCSACSSVTPIPALNTTFITPTKLESEQLAVGLQLHDKKQYHKAIEHYKLILNKNPLNAVALFEQALSYYALHDFNNSLRNVKLAATINSPFLENVYLLMGLNYENLHQIEQAITTYQIASRRFDKNVSLLYQLAKAHQSQQHPSEAVEIFKRIIQLDAYHRNSHLQLGLTYYEHDYKTPALLSLITFLLIEPDSKRAKYILTLIDDIFKSGVAVNKSTKQISLAYNPNSKQDEGNFSLIDNILPIHRIEVLLSKQESNEINIKREQFKSYLLALSQLKVSNNNNFVENFYIPFYKSIYKKELTTTLLFFTQQSSNNRIATKWLKNNKAKTNQLNTLFHSFKWLNH